MALLDLFRRAEPPDGYAPALVQTALDSNDPLEVSASAGRRERAAEVGDDVVAEALGTKLLHAWLQNRHQTLMPLSLNMSLLSGEQQIGLARILASLLLAGRPDLPAAAPAMRDWLAGLGAGSATLTGFDAALKAPMALNEIFAVAHAHDLTIYAYVAALMASDPRFPVSVMLCDMIQARFELPSALVRSAVRRYRR